MHGSVTPHWLIGCVLLLAGQLVLHAQEPPAAAAAPQLAFNKDRAFLVAHDFAPLNIGDPQRPEHLTFCDLVLHARQFEQDQLHMAARRDVALGDLLIKNDALRDDIRYELVEFRGRLKRLKRFGTFPELRAAGIGDLAEAWVFPPGAETPLCVIVSDWPTDIEPSLDITPSVPVMIQGYFYKVLEYESDEKNPKQEGKYLYRRAPLLIGHGFTMTENSNAQNRETLPALLPIVITGAAIVVVGILVLTYLYAKSDRGYLHHQHNTRRNPFDSSVS